MKKELAKRALKTSTSQLRQHNTLLRKNLRRVVGYSTENEKVQRRIDEMDDIIVESESLKVMFDALIIQGRRVFDIDTISVLLAHELKEHYPENYRDGGKSFFLESDNTSFVEPGELSSYFQDRNEPVLRGGVKKGDALFFTGGMNGRIRSEALAPLSYGKRIVGAVGFGSHNPTRFMDGYGVRFLKRLCRLLSLKMEVFVAKGA
ncbi:hypothetical protein MNBD_NITROSPINAE02-962 [hydrothermal vent metagenome]|uniref:GAF domain-containing protein n=1 Tax=hydrothermal vent metagenome TaxID=652676 RepID=A0A3B1D4I1_9ZZZZ